MSDENSLESRFFGEMVITDWRLQREFPGAYRDAALQLLIRPPVQLQGEMDTILFPLKHMESTKLVKHSASDQSHGTWWSDRSSLELPIHAHQKKKKYYRKNKEVSQSEKNKCWRKRTQKKIISRETKKKSRGRASGRQLAAQHKVLRITATGRGHLIFFPPKKTERKISSDRKTTTCKQEFVRRQFKHETCAHLM